MNQLLPSATTDNKGGNAMKNYLAFFACLALLLTLAGCQTDPNGIASKMGFSTPDNDAVINSETLVGSYDTALSAIERGDLTAAYEQLTHCDDPRAAELLEKLVFVPTSSLSETDKNMTFSRKYTYDDAGRIAIFVYTDKGRVTTSTYTYNDQGLLTKETTAYDTYTNVSTYDYNDAGLLVHALHKDHQMGSDLTYTYDSAGNLIRMVEKNTDEYDKGRVEEYTYDDAGRRTGRKTIFSDNNWVQDTITYYEDGAIASESDYWCESGIYNLTEYDRYGNITREQYRKKDEVKQDAHYTYTYDEKGNVLQKAEGDIVLCTYTYDQDGKLLKEEAGSGYDVYTYDEAGNLLSVINEDGRGKQYRYDEHNRLIGWGYVSPEGETGSSYNYTLDEYGNKTTILAYNAGTNWTINISWELRYYPDGVPEDVQEAIEGVPSDPHD